MAKNHPKATIFKKPERIQLKTYSHLIDQKRIPHNYELVTSNMLYYPKNNGFSVNTPILDWYRKYQTHPQIIFSNFDAFLDPYRLTYTDYIKHQSKEELLINEHMKYNQKIDYDTQLEKKWVLKYIKILSPLKYPWHGLQMVAAYLGSMAPESKLVTVYALQAMNEMRRIQGFTQRITQLQDTWPEISNDALYSWQHDPLWQSLRKTIEILLITYNSWEGFIGLNLCVKPLLDGILLKISESVKYWGDTSLCYLIESYRQDILWQQAWTQELVKLVFKENISNKIFFKNYIPYWLNLLSPILNLFEPLFIEDISTIRQNIFNEYRKWLENMEIHLRETW